MKLTFKIKEYIKPYGQKSPGNPFNKAPKRGICGCTDATSDPPSKTPNLNFAMQSTQRPVCRVRPEGRAHQMCRVCSGKFFSIHIASRTWLGAF